MQRIAVLLALALCACPAPKQPKPPAPPVSVTRALTTTAEAIRTRDFWTANQQLGALAIGLAEYRSLSGLSPRSSADVDRLAMEAEELSIARLEGDRLQTAWNGFFQRLTHVLRGEEVGTWPRLRVDFPDELAHAIAAAEVALAAQDRSELCGSIDKVGWLLAGWAGADPHPPRVEKILAAGRSLELGNECRDVEIFLLRQKWSEALALLKTGRRRAVACGGGAGSGRGDHWPSRCSESKRLRPREGV